MTSSSPPTDFGTLPLSPANLQRLGYLARLVASNAGGGSAASHHRRVQHRRRPRRSLHTQHFLDLDLLIEEPVVVSISDSFDLYWGSDWVTRPDLVVTDPQATARPLLLGSASAQEIALASELQQYRPQHQMPPCTDMHFVTDYPGSGVERHKVLWKSPELPGKRSSRSWSRAPRRLSDLGNVGCKPSAAGCEAAFSDPRWCTTGTWRASTTRLA